MYYRQTIREVSVVGLGYHIPHTLMYYRQTVREVCVGGLGYHIPDVLQADCKGGICGRSGVSYT